MNVELPNGYIIEGVPEGTSKEEIKAKAIAAGLATEADFNGSTGVAETAQAPALVEQPVEQPVAPAEQEKGLMDKLFDYGWGGQPTMADEGLVNVEQPVGSTSGYNKMAEASAEDQAIVSDEIRIREAAPYMDKAEKAIADNPEKYAGQDVFTVAEEMARSERVKDAATTAFDVATLPFSTPAKLAQYGLKGAAAFNAALGGAGELVGQGAKSLYTGDNELSATDAGISAGIGGGLTGLLGAIPGMKNAALGSFSDDGIAAAKTANRMNETIRAEAIAAGKSDVYYSNKADIDAKVEAKMDEMGVSPNDAEVEGSIRDQVIDDIISEMPGFNKKVEQAVKDKGIELLPTQMSDSAAISMADNMRAILPFGDTMSPTMNTYARQTQNMENFVDTNKFAEHAQQAIAELNVERASKGFDPASTNSTEFLGSVVDDVIKEMKRDSGKMYEDKMNRLQAAIAASPVKVRHLKPMRTQAAAEKIIRDAQRQEGFGLSRGQQNQIAKVLKQKPKDFRELDEWKRLFNSNANEAYVKGDRKLADAYKTLAKTIKEDAQFHAQRLGAEVGNIYKEADNAWRIMSEEANDKFIKSLVNTQWDSQTVRKMIDGKDGSEKINRIIKTLNKSKNKATLKAFQSTVLDVMMQNAEASAVGGRTAEFNAGAFGKYIRKNEDHIKSLFKDAPEFAQGVLDIGKMFDSLRSADFARGTLQQKIGQAGQAVGVVGTATNAPLTVVGAAASKLLDNGMVKLGKFMQDNVELIEQFRKSNNPYEKEQIAARALSSLAEYEDY